jgi:uncharacterized protein
VTSRHRHEERALPTVASLHRYPVKSMQGEALRRVSLERDGIAGDRRFALRDDATGDIASAKRPRPWRSLLDFAASTAGGSGEGTPIVRVPDGRVVAFDDVALRDAIERCTGRRVHPVLAQPDTLGSYDSTWPRVDGVTLAGDRRFRMALGTDAVRFVDVAALHLMTTSTLEVLRSLAPGSQVEAARFRPSIVIDTPGDEPGFLEDSWVGGLLAIGETARIRVSSRTPRCVMTTIEQPGLRHDAAILRAAAHNRNHFDGLGTLGCAGVYAEVVVPGEVAVGDAITLLPDQPETPAVPDAVGTPGGVLPSHR